MIFAEHYSLKAVVTTETQLLKKNFHEVL